MLRTFVTFEAALPDDGVWDDADNPIQPVGRNVAEALAERLGGAGVAQYKFYGWEFEVVEDAHRAWCLLQHPDPWLLIVEPRRSLRQRLLRRKDEDPWFSALLEKVDQTLRKPPFTVPRWFTEEEYAASSSP